MTRMRTKAAGAGVAVLLGMGGAVAVATSSGAQDTAPPEPPAEALSLDDRDGPDEGEHCDWLDGDLSEEDLAELPTEIQDEADAMIAALDAAGVEYQLVPDEELGVSFPEPTGDDEAAWRAFEDVLVELWAEEFAALPTDEQAEIVEAEQLFATELRAALDEAGIAYDLEVDPVTGVEFPVFDESDEAAWEALDRLEHDGFELFEDERFDDDLDDDDLEDDLDDDLDDDEPEDDDVDDEPEDEARAA